METNVLIQIVVLLLLCAIITFFYIMKNSAIQPEEYNDLNKDEKTMVLFIMAMLLALAVLIIITSVLLYDYYSIVF
jgi:nitrogen regulatory protein PII-like uncharacterized protein